VLRSLSHRVQKVVVSGSRRIFDATSPPLPGIEIPGIHATWSFVEWVQPTSTCFVIQGDPRNLPEYETQTFSENDVRQGGLNTA
jgi:hypothetical protein